MKTYKIRVYATMEFNIEAESESEANNSACLFVDNGDKEWDWNFDEIRLIK